MRVNEIFRSIQGEGPYAGQQAVFLRLTGCNLRCKRCDTAYAFDEGTEMDALEVLAELKRFKAHITRYVVVTGGEPLLQAKELGRVVMAVPPNVQFGIETNGTLFEIVHGTLQHRVHYIISPKGIGSFGDAKGRELYDEQWSAAAMFSGRVTFKFVVSSKSDVESVVAFTRNQNIPSGLVWLMPEGVTREKIFNKWPDVFNWAIEFGFHASCRLHTLAFGSKRGV